MRIAVVTTSFPGHDGDPSGHFVETEVHELEREGHRVVVITPPVGPGGAFGWPGVAARIRERPHRALGAASWIAKARRELAHAKPDRIVAHWALPSAWPIATASGAELEIVSHGGDVRLLAALPRALRVRLVRKMTERAAQWRFVSTSLVTTLIASLDERTAAALRRIAVVAPSPVRMHDVADAVRERRAALDGRPLYVCAGRLVASKRIDKVIDYVASKPRASSPVLVVLGDGPERARLETLAQRWALDARFLGTTARHEALSWIGAADEVVHASQAEGLSTVVREAEHLGVAVTVL
jgi:glycosyltransferase involved in cell wall biosynthesis